MRGLTNTVGTTVASVLDLVNQLDKSVIPNSLITIKGIEELSTAVDALNNIDKALANLLAYDEDVSVTVGENGELVADFTAGLGNHLESAVNDVVVQTLQNVVTALNALEIKILPEAEKNSTDWTCTKNVKCIDCNSFQNSNLNNVTVNRCNW